MQKRKLNQMTVSLSLILLVATATLTTKAVSAETAAPKGSEQKTIGFTFVNNKVPMASAMIFLAYWEPLKREWVNSSKQTDSNGSCSFLVPTGEHGESYTFVYSTTREEIEKAIQAVNQSKRAAWRIPPGNQQELQLLIELTIDGTFISNTKGSIQMWSID